MNKVICSILCIVFTIGVVFAENKKIKTLSIQDVVHQESWLEFTEHIKSCPDCGDENDPFKMCPTCYYLADAARPYISNDQMKMIAKGILRISIE